MSEVIPRNLGIVEEPYKPEGLYIIGGWVTTWLDHSQGEYAMAWGGYFKRAAHSEVIEGQLNDFFGPSTIMGNMDRNCIEFAKYYGHPGGSQRKVDYLLTRRESGLWEGRCVLPEDSRHPKLEGRASARVELFSDDAFFISFVGPRNRSGIRFGI